MLRSGSTIHIWSIVKKCTSDLLSMCQAFRVRYELCTEKKEKKTKTLTFFVGQISNKMDRILLTAWEINGLKKWNVQQTSHYHKKKGFLPQRSLIANFIRCSLCLVVFQRLSHEESIDVRIKVEDNSYSFNATSYRNVSDHGSKNSRMVCHWFVRA